MLWTLGVIKVFEQALSESLKNLRCVMRLVKNRNSGEFTKVKEKLVGWSSL